MKWCLNGILAGEGSAYLLIVMISVRRSHISGIGRCIAKELVKCGASVIALSKSAAELDTLKAEVITLCKVLKHCTSLT